jgi:hypothetical protein
MTIEPQIEAGDGPDPSLAATDLPPNPPVPDPPLPPQPDLPQACPTHPPSCRPPVRPGRS